MWQPEKTTADGGEYLVHFIYDTSVTSGGYVMVPPRFALEALNVITCESKWNTKAVGSLGERGLFQIHPIHKSRMATLGLDYDNESDRIKFAVVKWRESGWSAWSCKP